MLAVIFLVMLVPMIFLGLPMVSSYALSFVIPSLMTGQSVFSLSDIVSWLCSGAGKNTYVAIALFVISGELMSKGHLTERIFNIFAYIFGSSRYCFPLVAVFTSLFLRNDFRFRYRGRGGCRLHGPSVSGFYGL